MKKTTKSVVVILVALCLWLPRQAKADAIVSVSGPGAASVGDTITVDVNVAGANDLYAFQLDLGFDPAILSAVSVTEGTFLPGGGSTIFFAGAIDNTLGSVSNNADTLVSATPGVAGDGLLLAFQFSVIGTGSTVLTPENLLFLDSNFNSVSVSSAGGALAVKPAVATPEPGVFLLLLTGAFAAGIAGRKIFM
jgi:general secretion pathway protein D